MQGWLWNITTKQYNEQWIILKLPWQQITLVNYNYSVPISHITFLLADFLSLLYLNTLTLSIIIILIIITFKFMFNFGK